ncbi:MAG: hypothetical protein ACM3WV_04310 [Bacillota bacterium]
MIEIKEVLTGGDLRKFIHFPFALYAKNPFWVPPLIFDELNILRRDKNPAFAYCEAKYWLAYKDGKIAGRVAGIINSRHVEKWKQKYARFGWIDFVDDPDVCRALLSAVENWANGRGMTGVHGPLGFCDLDREGLLVEGFDRLSKMITIYNYPYYGEYIERCGYAKDVDWVELEIKIPSLFPEKLERIAAMAEKRSRLTVLKAKKPKQILPYVKGVFNLLNEAYSRLYGVVPLTDEQIRAYAAQYFGYIDPQYVRVLLDADGKVAAFGITMPSLSEALQKARGRLLPFGFAHILSALKKKERLDLYLIAVRPDLQNKGVPAVIIREIAGSVMENHFATAETAPMLEQNLKVQALWNYFDTKICTRRRCYLKVLR